MTERLKYHFEVNRGWINDPNGLVMFRGRYHAFFQYFPHEKNCYNMHWGHCVSDDLIHWEQLPIALFPDKEYEDLMGCYSGSAVVKDDRLYLIYTGTSHKYFQAQCVAYSDDGISFTKYEGNPVIKSFPEDGSKDFRDPKVTKFGDTYKMVVGSGKDGVGKVLMYSSTDLFNWTYDGVIFEDPEEPILECPDFFPFKDGYMLMYSKLSLRSRATKLIYGDFDGMRFSPRIDASPEYGPHFYAPQTFEDDKGRRILIAWLGAWGRPVNPEVDYTGAFTIPRELTLRDGNIYLFPVAEARDLLTDHDSLVEIWENLVTVNPGADDSVTVPCDDLTEIKILRDTKTIEVFLNGGEKSCTIWYKP